MNFFLEPPPSYILLDKSEVNIKNVHLPVHLAAWFHFVNVIF